MFGAIRSAQPADMNQLLQVWLNSVRATHRFLTEADIESLLPIVRDLALPSLELWILRERDDVPVGFMGLVGSSLEALFIDPSHMRRGGGRRLAEHARHLKGPLTVSVNEQNSDALRFYLACGFEVIGRSPVDGDGRPFPLLHMRDVSTTTSTGKGPSGRGNGSHSSNVVPRGSIAIHVGEAPEIEAFLAQRIYEFNAKATGYFDAESFSGTQRDEMGAIRAGVCGYTWGGCCYVTYLWVAESERGRGLGGELLGAAERHAKAKGCKLVLLATHTFQAPAFYERMGYKQQAVVQDHPVGHATMDFAKRLETNDS